MILVNFSDFFLVLGVSALLGALASIFERTSASSKQETLVHPPYGRPKQLSRWCSNLLAILSDYRSGRFYKPWKSTNPIFIVESKEQIAELSEAPTLSQRAVYADIFGFKHTMNGYDHNGNMTIRSRLFGRLLRVQSSTQLPALYPLLVSSVEGYISEELLSGRQTDDGVSIPISGMSKRLVSKAMGLIFFGPKLVSQPEFSRALLQYPQDVMRCMAAFYLVPSFLSQFVHSILTKGGQAMRIVFQQLEYIMGRGWSTWVEDEDIKKHTIMHNMVELTRDNDYWNPEMLAQALLGVWFAAFHQPWINLNFMLLELCNHPEWIAPLHEEILKFGTSTYEDIEKLQLLDSFMKETMRLNPVDTMAIRRKALKPYTFRVGSPCVSEGATVCVSSYNLMHNNAVYKDPDTFIGNRFISASQQRLTDVSENFPVWGYGSLACPGRYHGALVMKLVLVHIISNYSIRLEDENASQHWSWETFTLPYSSTRIVLKKRL